MIIGQGHLQAVVQLLQVLSLSSKILRGSWYLVQAGAYIGQGDVEAVAQILHDVLVLQSELQKIHGIFCSGCCPLRMKRMLHAVIHLLHASNMLHYNNKSAAVLGMGQCELAW